MIIPLTAALRALIDTPAVDDAEDLDVVLADHVDDPVAAKDELPDVLTGGFLNRLTEPGLIS